MTYTLPFFINLLQHGYIWVMAVLLATHLLLPPKRHNTRRLLYLANTLLLYLHLVNIASLLVEWIVALMGQSAYEQYAFYTNYPFNFRLLLVMALLNLLCVALLFFKRFRPTVWLSVVGWLSCFNFFAMPLFYWFHQLWNPDYLPSSWSTKPGIDTRYIVNTAVAIVVFSGLLAGLYRFTAPQPPTRGQDT
jgi:hypothetical protein